MKRKLSSVMAVLAGALLLMTAVSCTMESENSDTENNIVTTGKISGKVQYSNAEDNNHGGIIVTLDKTDGLRTLAVKQTVEPGSAVSSARAAAPECVSTADGSYLFENLEPGTYTVYASSPDSSVKAVCINVVVRAEKTTAADSLKLTATGSITGKITVDNSLTGNTDFCVFVAGTSCMAMTDDAGNYTISGVPAGEGYQLVAAKNGKIFWLNSGISVDADSSTEFSINFTSNEIDILSIVWLGSFDSSAEIKEPSYSNAFFNTTDGFSYVYNGEAWTLLTKSGTNGSNDTDGSEQTSIVWKGELPAAPSEPELYWAYYNTTDSCSYIYDGRKWTLLARSGTTGAADTDGKSIIWKGESLSAPENPELNWAYYNIIDGSSYVYNGEAWDLLAKGNNNSSSSAVIEGTTLTGWENPEGDITIPSGVTSIGDEAFAGCSGITSVTIPDSVTSIGEWAFSNCAELTRVNFEGTIDQWVNISFSDSKSNPLLYAHHLYIDDSELTDLIIPNNVTNIKEYAFYGCSGLTSVTIPGSVTSIESCAFTKCSGLTSVTIGNGVTSIGASAFSGCSGLTGITIPDSVTSIRSSAFKNCSGLTSITIPDSVTSIERGTFSGCSGLTSITIPDSVTSIKEETFTDCNNLTSVNYEGTLEQWLNISFIVFDTNPLYYAHHLYINDSEVTDLVIPEGVTSIGNYAFIGCHGLTSITIPDSVTSVGIEMCCDCINLSSITLPDNVTNIGVGAFRNCRALTSITIPDTVTSIKYNTFLKCSGLTSITIPASVTSIEDQAFKGCDNLTTVNYCGSAEQWAAISIGSDNSALTGATINYNYTEE